MVSGGSISSLCLEITVENTVAEPLVCRHSTQARDGWGDRVGGLPIGGAARTTYRTEEGDMSSRQRGWQRWLMGGIILLLPLLAGCPVVLVGAGAGAGAGAVAYIQGEHSQVHAGNYEKVWSAAVNALNQMNIRVIKTEKDSLGGTITARRADDTSVTVKVEPTGTDTATVKIRVGMFGDRAASESIQARIVTALGGGK
jgi:hypothetical protein